jgi:hypothetical protein
MSVGIDVVWENLIPSEKRKICTTFGLQDTEEGYNFIKTRFTREGIRLATAGEKLAGLFIAEYVPNPAFVGEFIAFFTSNAVMSAYVTEFLQLPFEFRPGVNPLRLGDLFFAFVTMGSEYAPETLQKVASFDLRRFERSKKNYIAVIEWLLEKRQINSVSVEELRRDLHARTEKSEKERKARSEELRQTSISCEDYNVWRRTRVMPPLNHKHPIVQFRYMTRSGQERSILACLCCAAVEPKDCTCPSEEEVKAIHLAKNNNSIASTIFEEPKKIITGKNNNNGDDDHDRNGDRRQFPSSSSSSTTLQERYHPGTVEECRLSKSRALKIQNIACWSCCGVEAAKVNTTPIGFEVIAERTNGCCKGRGEPAV